MQLKLDHVFLIISKDEKLVAKGVPRNRYICHIDEKTNKRLLTYRSKNVAINAFMDCGFYLSKEAKKYISDNYPEIKETHWDKDIQNLFEAKEFIVTYESI